MVRLQVCRKNVPAQSDIMARQGLTTVPWQLSGQQGAQASALRRGDAVRTSRAKRQVMHAKRLHHLQANIGSHLHTARRVAHCIRSSSIGATWPGCASIRTAASNPVNAVSECAWTRRQSTRLLGPLRSGNMRVRAGCASKRLAKTRSPKVAMFSSTCT